MRDRKIAWIVTLLVVVHGFINLGHLVAHWELGVQMSLWQKAFIILVIGLGPVFAAVLLWTSYSFLGTLLLAGSFTGALAFGVYFHYVEISQDNVAHLPEGDLQGLFQSTSLLLALSQIMGIGVALWSFWRMRKTLLKS